jgi:microcystin-dependent protein
MSLSSLVDPSDLNGALQSMDDRLKALESTGIIPVGLCAFCAGVVPSGWLLMDGSTIQATRYGQLVTYLGGSTSVALPNAAGRIMVGKNAATFATMLSTGGVETVTLTAAQSGVPAHTHATGNGQDFVTTNNVAVAASGASFGAQTGNVTNTAANTTAAAGSSHSNLQPYIVLAPIIKF